MVTMEERTRPRRPLRVAAAATLSLVAASTSVLLDSAVAAADSAIETTYAAPGPHEVIRSSVAGPGGAVRFELYLPADLDDLAEPAPVVSWGNGSDATPAQYDGLLRHLASWGFAVVAPTTTSAGDGTEIVAAARWAADVTADRSSPHHGRFDASAIGVAGHSQGAGGSVRAASSSDLVRTAVMLSLPSRIWVSSGRDHEFAPRRLRVPVLFLSGEDDIVISNPLMNREFYDEVPGAAGMAMLAGAGHLEPQGDGDGFRGYITAWLRYQLADDATAAGAFVGPSPELLGNARWRHRAVKGLAPVPSPAAAVPPTPPTAPAPEPQGDVEAPGGEISTTGPPAGAGPFTSSLPATGGQVDLVAAGAALLAGLGLTRRLRRVRGRHL